MSEIVKWGAVETVQKLRAKDVSAVEVCEAHLARLETVRDLNAVVEDVPQALDWAREIDAGTRDGGLLAGAPITTKINADMAGFANSNGIVGLAKNMCAEDSAVVGNLKAAGGVIIGRTNTPEMSMRWCTSNPLYGVTLNPWDHELTPGGSSGGGLGLSVLWRGCDCAWQRSGRFSALSGLCLRDRGLEALARMYSGLQPVSGGRPARDDDGLFGAGTFGAVSGGCAAGTGCDAGIPPGGCELVGRAGERATAQAGAFARWYHGTAL